MRHFVDPSLTRFRQAIEAIVQKCTAAAEIAVMGQRARSPVKWAIEIVDRQNLKNIVKNQMMMIDFMNMSLFMLLNYGDRAFTYA